MATKPKASVNKIRINLKWVHRAVTYGVVASALTPLGVLEIHNTPNNLYSIILANPLFKDKVTIAYHISTGLTKTIETASEWLWNKCSEYFSCE